MGTTTHRFLQGPSVEGLHAFPSTHSLLRGQIGWEEVPPQRAGVWGGVRVKWGPTQKRWAFSWEWCYPNTQQSGAQRSQGSGQPELCKEPWLQNKKCVCVCGGGFRKFKPFCLLEVGLAEPWEVTEIDKGLSLVSDAQPTILLAQMIMRKSGWDVERPSGDLPVARGSQRRAGSQVSRNQLLDSMGAVSVVWGCVHQSESDE